MSLFRMGPFDALMHDFEPGDVVGIEAAYEIQRNGVYTHHCGFLYTTVLQKTHEEIMFTVLVADIIDCRLAGIVRHSFGSRILTMHHAETLRNVCFVPYEHIILFKGIRRDIANAHLALLASSSERKN